jgi:polar amino acid transport system ATP-binding protein
VPRKPILEIHGLRKSFGDTLVLNNISLSVEENQVVCVIGASGSGKSTLLRCVNLLLPIDDGQIILDGQDISDPRINQDQDLTRAQIGVVFQHFNLFPHMNVLANVTLGLRKVFRVPQPEANQQGMELLKRIGIEAKAQDYPDKLSGGEQQRVAIARAMITKPKLLLLDEVTSALDPNLSREVLDMILELKKDKTTILMSTHDMGFAEQAADWVVFLHQGILKVQNRPDVMLLNPEDSDLRNFLDSEKHYERTHILRSGSEKA